MALEWPAEIVLGKDQIESWYEPGSNRIMDFHGDPLKAKLVVFSDGNHHMALLEALEAFYQQHPQVADIFYATTPPYPIVKLLRKGAIRLGNEGRTYAASGEFDCPDSYGARRRWRGLGRKIHEIHAVRCCSKDIRASWTDPQNLVKLYE